MVQRRWLPWRAVRTRGRAWAKAILAAAISDEVGPARSLKRVDQWRSLADNTRWASSPIAAGRHEFQNQAPINNKESIKETSEHPEAWNKGTLVGQKAPLKPKDIWAIGIHLQNAHAVRDLAMFNLAIDSKLRG